MSLLGSSRPLGPADVSPPNCCCSPFDLPYVSSSLVPLPPLPPFSPADSFSSTMPDPAQATQQAQPAAAAQPASKSKHTHATSQAAPAPRKVRFNVGMYPCEGNTVCVSYCFFKVLNTRCSTLSAKVRMVSYVRLCTALPGARWLSRRLRPLITPCSVCVPFVSSSCSSSSARLASVKMYVN